MLIEIKYTSHYRYIISECPSPSSFYGPEEGRETGAVNIVEARGSADFIGDVPRGKSFSTANIKKLVTVSLFDPDPQNLVNKDHWAAEMAWADGRNKISKLYIIL